MSNIIRRRDFLKRSMDTLGLLTLESLCGLSRAASATPTLKNNPDILFLLADDLAFNLIGALGCDEVHTPNLDRLVHRGVHFSNCYNQGGWHGAICVASRTMLLTGRFLWDAHNTDPHMSEESAARHLWPQYLQEAGYRTYISGKWHVNCDPATVFQVTRNIRPGMPPDILAQYDRPHLSQPDTFAPSDPALGGFFTGGRHWSEVLADDAVNFLHETCDHDAPFFMYLAFNAPHDPRQSPKAFLDLYPPDAIRTPVNFSPEYPFKEAMGCGPDLRDERLAPFPRTEHAIRAHRREYYATISHLDAQIGRILEALEASGRSDNTCIIFTADNGLAAGHHGLMGKQNMFEHSMKVPLIIAGPGIPANQRLDPLVYMQDIVPTTLELAGRPIPAHIAYQSLLPLISGVHTNGYEAVYGAYMNTQRMVRTANHKLIWYPSINKFLLFDLVTDPHEQHNLTDIPEWVPRLRELMEMLYRLQIKLGDSILLPQL